MGASCGVQPVPKKCLMIGSYGAGRTTMLYQMKFGELVTTNPTIGFNIETFHYKGNALSIWDSMGQEQISRLWPQFVHGIDALIVVVGGKFQECIRDDQPRIVSAMAVCEAEGIPVLIYNNGSDLDEHLTNQEVADILQLHARQGCFHIQESCAVAGYGLWEGIDWLIDVWAGRIYFSSGHLGMIVLEVHPARRDIHTWCFSCTNMAGEEVVVIQAAIRSTTIGELWEAIGDRLHVSWRMLRLVFPGGKLICDRDRHSTLADKLESKESASPGRCKQALRSEPRSPTELLSGLNCYASACT